MASDAHWYPIVDMPGHTCAFEVVAATARPVERGRRGFSSILRWLIGIPHPVNSVAHAMVSANGTDEKPQLTTRAHPDSARAWRWVRQYLVALFAIFVLAVASDNQWDIEIAKHQIRMDLMREIKGEITGAPPLSENSDGEFAIVEFIKASGQIVVELFQVNDTGDGAVRYRTGWLTLAVISMLLLLRLVVGALITRRNSVRLKWVPDGGRLLTGAYAGQLRRHIGLS